MFQLFLWSSNRSLNMRTSVNRYNLGMGKNVSKSSLAIANQDRDCHTFEEFAYYLVNQARYKRVSYF